MSFITYFEDTKYILSTLHNIIIIHPITHSYSSLDLYPKQEHQRRSRNQIKTTNTLQAVNIKTKSESHDPYEREEKT